MLSHYFRRVNRWSNERSMRSSRPTRPTRMGIVILSVFTCFIAATTLMLGLLTFSLGQQRQVSRLKDSVQTTWLLDAGISRGYAAMQVDADYQGETIELTWDDLIQRTARVDIKLRRQPNSVAPPATNRLDRVYLLEVQVELLVPGDDSGAVRKSDELRIVVAERADPDSNSDSNSETNTETKIELEPETKIELEPESKPIPNLVSDTRSADPSDKL